MQIQAHTAHMHHGEPKERLNQMYLLLNDPPVAVKPVHLGSCVAAHLFTVTKNKFQFHLVNSVPLFVS